MRQETTSTTIYTTNNNLSSCAICGKKAHNPNSLAKHIGRTHQCTSQIYYDLYLKKENDGICKECGQITKFLNIRLGYQTWCGMRCANVEKVRNNWKNPKFRERRRETMLGNILSMGRPKGSKNKNPYPMTEAVLNRLELTAHHLDWTGKKHTLEYKKHMSELMIARIEKDGLTMSYKGKFKPSRPERYNGDPTNIVYRSHLELRVMQHLDSNPNILKWESEERFVRYFDPVSAKLRRYFPDFLVTTTNGVTMMIEVKPLQQTKPPTIQPHVDGRKNRRYIKESTTFATNMAKFKAAEEYCADRGWKFKIITDKDIKSW